MSTARLCCLLLTGWFFLGAPWSEAVAQPPSLPEALDNAIRTRNFEAGLQRIQAEIEAAPDDLALAQRYSSFLSSISRDGSEEGFQILREVVDQGFGKPSPGIAEKIAIASAVQTLLLRDEDFSIDSKLALLGRLDHLLEGDDFRLESSRRLSLNRRIALLLATDRREEAGQQLEQLITASRTGLDPADGAAVQRFVNAVTTFQGMGGPAFSQRAEELIEEALELTKAAVEEEKVSLAAVSAYFSIRLNVASTLARTEPDRAEAVLRELLEALEWVPERLDQQSARSIATYARSIQSIRSRVEASKKINAMIGREATEIDAEHFVATDPVSMASLRGKVVLIDFWAVWCGPCIATFPHLIEWHEKYSDRGLVILGATRFYGYRWDEEAGRAMRADDVSVEAELTMLEKFRESHGLRHGFFITADTSDYQAAFGVTGIPHAVVIDQEGKIQMVRIGSGQANARDLEAKIEELLDG